MAQRLYAHLAPSTSAVVPLIASLAWLAFVMLNAPSFRMWCAIRMFAPVSTHRWDMSDHQYCAAAGSVLMSAAANAWSGSMMISAMSPISSNCLRISTNAGVTEYWPIALTMSGVGPPASGIGTTNRFPAARSLRFGPPMLDMRLCILLALSSAPK